MKYLLDEKIIGKQFMQMTLITMIAPNIPKSIRVKSAHHF